MGELPALALAAERAEAGLMERPPRRRAERLLSWPLLALAMLAMEEGRKWLLRRHGAARRAGPIP